MNKRVPNYFLLSSLRYKFVVQVFGGFVETFWVERLAATAVWRQEGPQPQ